MKLIFGDSVADNSGVKNKANNTTTKKFLIVILPIS